MAKAYCKECGKECEHEGVLHRHIKAHKLNQAAYYQKHFPRFDKYDRSLINFKNRDFYLTADFNNKDNLKRWMQKVQPEEVRLYVRDYLVRRQARKKLEYALSQVELRSLPIPGMSYLNKLFPEGYYKLCDSLGFKIKFSSLGLVRPSRNFLPNHKIIVDTREQAPLTFKLPTISEALPFGDYKLNDDEFTRHCSIERKTMSDLYGTLTGGYDRFCRELNRSVEAKAYVVILVESGLETVETFSGDLTIYSGVKLAPEFVFFNMREICQNYANVQFLFVENREQASRAIERLFAIEGSYKDTDLQYAYDTGTFF